MNRDDDEIERIPIPEGKVARFLVIILSMVEEFGITEVPSVYHHIEELEKAVNYHLWEERHKVSPQRRVHNARKRFISIFKVRYLQLTDLEYNRRITPVDAKCINQTNRTLRDAGSDAETYLKWLFEEYLVENQKFCPPTIKQICSSFFVHKFIFEAKQRSADTVVDTQEKDAHDLIGRGRVLLRSGLEKEDDKKLREKLKDYSEGRIILHELKKFIEALERQ